MPRPPTVGEVLARARRRRQEKRCPECGAVVSVQGFKREYRWVCNDCDAIGIGYPHRSDALEALRP